MKKNDSNFWNGWEDFQALIADWCTEHFLIDCKYTLYVDISELYDSVSQTMFCGTLMSSRW